MIRKVKIKRKEKGRNISFIVAIILFIIAIFMLIFSVINDRQRDIKFGGGQNITEDCDEGDIIKNAKCTHEWVLSFFSYNISQVGKELTLEELKEQGGVCYHYSKLFCEIGKNFGYYTKRVLINIDNDTSHSFCIWSNEEAYVKLDQENIDIFKFVQ